MADEGQTGTNQIERLAKGDKTRTARHSAVMNEIIDRLNSLLKMEVKPGSGEPSIQIAEGNAVLTVGSGLPEAPTSGIFVLTDRNGNVEWDPVCDSSDTGLKID